MTDIGRDEIRVIAGDPEWFPLRYDYRGDAIHFVRLDRAGHRSAGFLKNARLTAELPRRVVPRDAIAADLPARAPLHLIMHSGLTCSTLLGRALDQPGTAMTLSEPPILTDLVAHRLNGASRHDAAHVLQDVVRLLARPFEPGEAVIVKMGSVGNALGPEILAEDASSRALCLHAPLPIFLAAIARKGLWGRLWGRKLFLGLHNARMPDLGFTDADYLEHTDLQFAADAWLTLHRLMAVTGNAVAGGRVRAIDSERLTADFPAALAAIGAHFGLTLDSAAIVDSALFARHAKSGEAFDLRRRSAELNAALETHGDEIGVVVGWADKVAQGAGVPSILPGQLEVSAVTAPPADTHSPLV